MRKKNKFYNIFGQKYSIILLILFIIVNIFIGIIPFDNILSKNTKNLSLINEENTDVSNYFVESIISPLIIDSKYEFEQGTWENLNITDEGIKLAYQNDTDYYKKGYYLSPIYDTQDLSMWDHIEWDINNTNSFNLIPNGDFEIDIDNNNIPDNWTGTINAISKDNMISISGEFSLKLNGGNNYVAYSELIPINPIKKYYIFNYLKLDMIQGDFYIQAEFYNETKHIISQYNTLQGGHFSSDISEFMLKTFIIDIQNYNPNSRYMKIIYKWWNSFYGPNGTAWIDNLIVIAGDEFPIKFQSRTSIDNNTWSPWSGDNYNSDFEMDYDNDGKPDHWSGTNNAISMDNIICFSGNSSLKLTAGINYIAQSDFISISHNETYLLSQYLKINMTLGNFYVQAYIYNRDLSLIDYTTLGTPFSSGISSFSYQDYNISMNLYDPSAQFLKITYKWWHSMQTPDGAAWIDQIKLISSDGTDLLCMLEDTALSNIYGISSPQGQYFQYAIKITTTDTLYTPILKKISIFFNPTIEFYMPWDDGINSIINSDQLNAPAGKYGFLKELTTNGHFYFGNGKRAKFWGVQMYGAANFPTHEQSEKIVARLAKLGFNAIKTQIDSTSDQSSSIINVSYDDTQHLHEGQLDKLDYFIYQCKERGIYTYMRLHATRNFKAGDLVQDWDKIKYSSKYVTLFNDRIIDLQKDYAAKLMNHINPYTGLAYKNDPGILFVELTNENSLFLGWLKDALDGNLEQASNEEIPISYANNLTSLWNLWLLTKYVNRTNLEASWNDGTPGTGLLVSEDLIAGTVERVRYNDRDTYTDERISDMCRFYYEIDKNYFLNMSNYLKNDLGINQLIVGTNNHYGLPSLKAQALMDFTDTHLYWDHPLSFELLPSQPNYHSKPMVKNVATSTITRGAVSKVAGKPLTITEYDHAFPNPYGCEAPILISSYMAFQDWDGIFLFTYNHHDDWEDNSHYIDAHFKCVYDPVTMAQNVIASRLFLRQDVQPATKVINISYSDNETFDHINYFGNANYDYGVSGGTFPYEISLIHRVQKSSFNSPTIKTVNDYYNEFNLSTPTNPYISDTGELTWNTELGIVTVDTFKTQSAVGFLNNKSIRLMNMELDVKTEFSSISITSLDQKDISLSRSILLTALAKVENTNLIWDSFKKRLLNWGTAPVLLEPVEAYITINIPASIANEQGVKIHILDEKGQRTGKLVKIENYINGTSMRKFSFNIGRADNTIWYEIEPLARTIQDELFKIEIATYILLLILGGWGITVIILNRLNIKRKKRNVDKI